MPQIHKHYNLKNLNTFGIEAYCDAYTELSSIEDFKALMVLPEYRASKKLILGGGSNMLFVADFKGLVIRNCLKGITLVKGLNDEVLVKSAAGENWHEFVMWCIQHNYAGLENLSLIPGCVGASPMQNIGAYGVEIKDVFEELEAFDMSSGQVKMFSKQECQFGYRESVFKREFKEKYLIVSVTFRLKKKAVLNTSYGAIGAELERMGVKQAGIKEVSEAVMRIRQSKLPDPKIIGNAGSFFKNPTIQNTKFEKLKNEFPNIIGYPVGDNETKLAAGWLIEQCGWKGYRKGDAGCHEKQALVLVNYGNAIGEEILQLSEKIIDSVKLMFDVELHREVNIVEKFIQKKDTIP
jgi:UDP-N-acetylmuramate dehydrogenase